MITYDCAALRTHAIIRCFFLLDNVSLRFALFLGRRLILERGAVFLPSGDYLQSYGVWQNTHALFAMVRQYNVEVST